jgi:hypothetical protein
MRSLTNLWSIEQDATRVEEAKDADAFNPTWTSAMTILND